MSPLSHWMRLLWGQAPALVLGSEQPFIAGGTLHLPARPSWQAHCAAAAHAAAHLVYSPGRFEATGMVPITRVLLALLEDARVEALACRELPGLARLWRPLHRASPADGTGFEALMGRLARALADPGYDDAHPWVRKGLALFYLDRQRTLLALRTPDELAQAARRLGHDIGQMRLPFNAKTYRPTPDYRDDHRWMWSADDLRASPPPAPNSPGATDQPPETAADDADGITTRLPEWDRLIARLRLDWCTVIERPAATPSPALPACDDDATWALGQRLRAPLRALIRPATARRRSLDGELFDLDALVQWQTARRSGRPGDARVHLRPQGRASQAAVWLLVDQSASTAAAHGSGSVLQAATRSAAAAALALQALGVACAISGFHSNSRHAVQLNTVQRLGDPPDPALAQRLQGLHSTGSTRLGAALRHATAGLATHRHRRGPRWVWLLSDGQPHDVDVHDPNYLVADARHAVREASRQAVRMACFTLAADGAGSARRIFGRRGAHALATLDALPRIVQRLLA